MEDMARLAVLEQNVRDAEVFSKTLLKLLEYIGYILENPHDYDLRTIKSDFLKRSLDFDGFTDYLTYIGFQINDGEIMYPKEQSLNKLRMARAAIERKLHFSHGAVNLHSSIILKSSQSQPRLKVTKLTPSHVLNTNNEFLLKLEQLFNDVLKYEDEDLQRRARELIPVVNLQLKALDRMREHQRKIKTGEIEGTDMSFDTALLMELLGWFKWSFFTWVDKPACERCGGATVFDKTSKLQTDVETCRLEVYRCTACSGGATFARYNDVGTLLRSRRGRCGEWANCFTLLCRALGYDARYVYDVTDHVWTEVFDYDSNRWLHCDPCEAVLDAPLIYENGWGKKLSYVLAASRDDIQDVTWRYSSNHEAVRSRRHECSEEELISTVMMLREYRQSQVSSIRRQYLTRRGVQELVQLMVERKPSDYENRGRISGSTKWRQERGEIGSKSHTFEFSDPGLYTVKYCTVIDKYRVIKDGGEVRSVDTWAGGAFVAKNVFRKEEKDWRMVYLAREDPGLYTVKYCTAIDKYRVIKDGGEVRSVDTWAGGAFVAKNVFRKEENDWRMVYLAREEDASTGSISWRISAADDMLLNSLTVKVSTSLYEDAVVDWTIKFDNEDPLSVEFPEDAPRTYARQFKEAILTAALSGGRGHTAWQHAQLFRQSADDGTDLLEIAVRASRA